MEYNIILVFPDGRQFTFQSDTMTVNGLPSTKKNHVIVLGEEQAAEIIEAAKQGDSDGFIHCALEVVPNKSFDNPDQCPVR